MVLFNMLNKVFRNFKSVNEPLVCGHPNERSSGSVYYNVQCGYSF